MENNLIIKVEQEITPETERKIIGWSKIGLLMHNIDLKLQIASQQTIAKIKIPTTVEEIVEAEKLVIELRSDYTSIQKDRKELTARFDAASEHLMKYEKAVAAAVPPLNEAILKLKKMAEEQKDKVQYHDNEIKSLKEKIGNYIAEHDAECKRKILHQVEKAYSYALGNVDIKLEELNSYLTKVKAALKIDDFLLKRPVVQQNDNTGIGPQNTYFGTWKITNITLDEAIEIWDIMAPDATQPESYISLYFNDLETKFEHYNIAVKNKQASLEAAAKEAKEAEEKIKKDQSSLETANKLNSLANSNATVNTTHRELKKVYTINLVENDEQFILNVAAAFITNLEKVRGGIRVKSLWKLSIEQMATALEWHKNKDANFECGVPFMLIDKL